MRNEFAAANTAKVQKEKKQGDLPRNFTNYQKVEKDHGKILAKFLFNVDIRNNDFLIMKFDFE